MAVSFTPTVVTNPLGAQGQYPLRQTVGHEGMIADMQAYVSRSYRNETGAAIPFGLLVTQDTASGTDDFAVKIATSASTILGLTVSSLTFEGASLGSTYTPSPTPVYSDGRYGFADKETMNVLSKGVVFVHVTEAVDLDSAVRFWNAVGTPGVAGAFLGRWCKTGVNSKTTAVTSGARWLSKTTGAGLALLELDLPAATFVADTAS